MPKRNTAQDVIVIDRTLGYKEVQRLVDQYGLSAQSFQALSGQDTRTRIVYQNDYLHFVLRFPLLESESIKISPVHFLVSAHFLIILPTSASPTTHRLLTNAKKEIIRREPSSLSEPIIITATTLYHYIDHDLEDIDHEISQLEESVFAHAHRKLIPHIALLTRQVIDIQQAIRFHGLVLKYIKDISIKEKGISNLGYLEQLLESIMLQLSTHRDTLFELQKTHEMIISSRTNQATKSISIAAFSTLPTTLAIQLFSMNTNIGLFNHITTGQFLTIITSTIFISLAVISYLHYRELL